MDEAPFDEVVSVTTASGFKCDAIKFIEDCTGMCVPKGQKIHTFHTHTRWVMVDEYGDTLHFGGGNYAEITPVKWEFK